MYAKIINGVVEEYPFSIARLKQTNPNTSFPEVIPVERLADWNVYPVVPTERPVADHLHTVVESAALVGGVCTQVWKLKPSSNADIAERTAVKSESVRELRNALLTSTDWRFRVDMMPSQAWLEYCQALRDVTSQAGFPWNVEWPVAPE